MVTLYCNWCMPNYSLLLRNEVTIFNNPKMRINAGYLLAGGDHKFQVKENMKREKNKTKIKG